MSDVAKKIIEIVLDELGDRAGVGDELECIDEETMKELKGILESKIDKLLPGPAVG